PRCVTGSSLHDLQPAGVTFSVLSASYAGRPSLHSFPTRRSSDLVSIPVGGTATFTVSASIASSLTGDLVNAATVSPPDGTSDIRSAEHTSTLTSCREPICDLAIEKTDSTLNYTAGTTTTYMIVAS